jgi:ribosome maturation factor RimP
MRSAQMSDLEVRLWDLVEPYLAAEHIELDDLDVRGGGGARLVRVVVDAEKGVAVDTLATVSKGLERLIDQSNLVAGAYTLEVSSPGLERTLRRPAHFAKAIGREAVVTTRVPVAGVRKHRGVIDGVAGGAVALRVEDEARLIPLDEVEQARTVFRWEKAPKPGHK